MAEEYKPIWKNYGFTDNTKFSFSLAEQTVGLTDEIDKNISSSCVRADVPHLRIEYPFVFKNFPRKKTDKCADFSWDTVRLTFYDYENSGVLNFFYFLQNKTIELPDTNSFDCYIILFNNSHQKLVEWVLHCCVIGDIDEQAYEVDLPRRGVDTPREFSVTLIPENVTRLTYEAEEEEKEDFSIKDFSTEWESINIVEGFKDWYEAFKVGGVSKPVLKTLVNLIDKLSWSSPYLREEILTGEIDRLDTVFNRLSKLIIQSVSTHSSLKISDIIEKGLTNDDVDEVLRCVVVYLRNALSSSLSEIQKEEFCLVYGLELADAEKIVVGGGHIITEKNLSE